MYPTKNLSQIHNSLLNNTHTEHKFGIIFDEHPTFSPPSKYCYIHMCKLLAPVLTSILTQPVPLLTPMSTLNLTTVTLSTTTFLSLK